MNNEVGYVTSSRDYLIYLDGLPSVHPFDLLQNEQGVFALTTALFEDKVEAWILSEGTVLPGQLFKKTDIKLNINVSSALFGRAINPLGTPIDGKGTILNTRAETSDLSTQAKDITSRAIITQQFLSGLILIDTLLPIGRGQRELIIGDAHSGKTSFLMDVVANQAQQGTICIVASIGKPISELRSTLDILRQNKAISSTIVVATSSSDPSPLIFFTPHAALGIAEYFQAQGKDVLVILDDMGIHAKTYRELSLLGGRPPGRESYPGDIFFIQARLLERAGRFNTKSGGGSITALPVVEINLNDFTTFIPTNLMAMTDGHLFFRASLHAQGFQPAIDIATSVTRVGRQTQPLIVNLLSQTIRQILTEAESLQTVERFAQELPAQTKNLLKQNKLFKEMLKQDTNTFVPQEVQVALLGLVLTSFFDSKDVLYLQKNKKTLLQTFLTNPKFKALAKSLLDLKSLGQLVNKLEQIKL